MSRNAQKVLNHDTREQKTDHPSKINLTVLVPMKRDEVAAGRKSYLVALSSFNHNHPIHSAHVLYFLETKEKFVELFWKGHTAASAHHWHKTKLYIDGGEDQVLLADRATNSTGSYINRLYIEWQKKRNLEMTVVNWSASSWN